MGDFDPVSWETVEAAIGPPAPAITASVDRFRDQIAGADPYDAVKVIHDALADTEGDRTVPGLGDPFLIAYLLEKDGIISPDGDETGGDYRSIVERRPEDERLMELFWARERTLWWIGVLAGVHPSLVTYWFYEADIPLMERNYTAESMAQIRSVRESRDG